MAIHYEKLALRQSMGIDSEDYVMPLADYVTLFDFDPPQDRESFKLSCDQVGAALPDQATFERVEKAVDGQIDREANAAVAAVMRGKKVLDKELAELRVNAPPRIAHWVDSVSDGNGVDELQKAIEAGKEAPLTEAEAAWVALRDKAVARWMRI